MTGLDPAHVPAELRTLDQWVIWRPEIRDGDTTKVPYRTLNPNSRASSTDPATWASFEQTLNAAERLNVGFGFVFAEPDPFTGVDLDDCLDDDGRLHPDAGAVIADLDSYSEISPSGRGVKTIIRADLNSFPRNRTDKTGWGGKFEVYNKARFFTITGQIFRGCSPSVEPRQAELEEVLQFVFGDLTPAEAAATPARPVDINNRELLERAFAASNGGDLRQLYAGGWQNRYGSQSEADLALCAHLAFWTGRDPGRMDALFRTSGLMRPKWDERRGVTTYGALTIEEAITGTLNVYNPQTRNGVRGSDAVDSVDSVGGPGEADTGYGVTASALKDAVLRTQKHQREKSDSETASESDADPPSEPDPWRPFSMPIREFVALERPRREPLLADADGRAVIGRRSLTLLGALGGHGKTTLFVDLALHLVAGVDYPPFTVPDPVNILMIENEGPEELFAEKLANRLDSFPHELKGQLDVFTFDWGGFSLGDGAYRDRLTAEIAEKGYDLVFGDPLDSLGIEGVGSPQDTRDFMSLMKETGLNKTVAWWLNTHPRKEEAKEALNEISGAWGGKPDSVLLLRMLEDDRTQLRFPKLRWTKRGTRPAILLAFDADTEAFTFLGEESEVKREYLREVFALLQSTPWRTAKEIAAPAKDGGIGANDKAVKKVLDEHPEIFESRTGDEAVALDRKSTATLWGLRPDAVKRLIEFEDGET